MNSKLIVKYTNDEIIILSGKNRLYSRATNKSDIDQFCSWIESYNQALQRVTYSEIILKIGQEIYTWLNGENKWLDKYLKNAPVPLIIEFQIPKSSIDVQNAFIEVPWELLADHNGHLAKDAKYKFSPIRRIGDFKSTEKTVSKYRLNTVFMAAAPRNVKPVLAYENEESAILHLYAEKSLEMDLFVEESGNLTHLADLVTEYKPVDVVHISCHGNIYTSDKKNPQPYLCLEDDKGNRVNVDANKFDTIYSENRPSLVFLSSCKTAESFESKEYNSFSQNIIKRGFSAVLGWSGSVGDAEATRFAGELYHHLSQCSTLEKAVAWARFSLFNPPKEQLDHYESKAWHLARLYLGSYGGGKITDGLDKRFIREMDAGIKEFLDKKGERVPVANRREFVGRRRPIQDIFREFDNKENAGVLILGFGNQGKSSLAARIANRMYKHQTVVIFGGPDEKRRYKAYHILKEFKTIASADTETEKKINAYLQDVDGNEQYLKSCLKELINGPFSGKDATHPPVLLVIDDLEKILIKPKENEQLYSVEEDYRTTLISVIKAFKEAYTASRLLITSRYDFDLFDEETTYISRMLYKLPLPSMKDTEALKQYFAKYGMMPKKKKDITLEPERVVEACKGNPGLQEMLFKLFTFAPEKYKKALQDMEKYLESGRLPKEKAVLKFLQDLALDTILELLTNGEKELLQTAKLFDIPVTDNVFDSLAEEIGIKKKTDYKKRLVGFGILEAFEDPVLVEKIALLLNKIVSPKIITAPQELFAGIITKNLIKNWCISHDENRPWICDREIVKFGLIVKNVEAVKKCAVNAVRGMHNHFLTKEAYHFAVDSITLLENKNIKVPADFYEVASNVCHQLGDIARAEKYILSAINETDKTKNNAYNLGKYYGYTGRILIQQGKVEESLKKFEIAGDFFSNAGASRELAINTGDIARIKVSKGEVDEALKLHEERLKVFDKLGDTRSKAVTLGDIARIKVSKGEVDEALKLHEEELEVYDKLGDTRSKAVTLGDIARIKVDKGEVDEALKLHEERLKVFDKLGDISSKAQTLWRIAKIQIDKKNYQNAFECLAESYKINLKLGRLDGICFVGLDLGIMLCQADQKEEGLEILKRSRDGFKKLGYKNYASQVEDIINQIS